MATRTNPQVDRYQLVKLRSNIRAHLIEYPGYGMAQLYRIFLRYGYIPVKSNGEQLDLEGFMRSFRIVKKDLNHSYTEYSIRFLARAVLALRGRYKNSKSYNGLRELVRLTGLHEVTIKDILILNGEMR